MCIISGNLLKSLLGVKVKADYTDYARQVRNMFKTQYVKKCLPV